MSVKHEYEEKTSFQTCSEKFKHGGNNFKLGGPPCLKSLWRTLPVAHLYSTEQAWKSFSQVRFHKSKSGRLSRQSFKIIFGNKSYPFSWVNPFNFLFSRRQFCKLQWLIYHICLICAIQSNKITHFFMLIIYLCQILCVTLIFSYVLWLV